MTAPSGRHAWFGVAFSLCLALCIQPAAWAQVHDPFTQPAAAYVLMVQGETLWARHPMRPLPPASLTKVMTALLVQERARPDDVVTIGPDAARETGSRLGLHVGERIRVSDLLAAILLTSANDACHALADHIAGGETRFVEWMNRRAQELGLRQTRFANACGHDQDGHYSSAHDLAVLAQTAMDNPAFAALVATVRMTVRTLDGRRSYELENKNELIGRYPGAVGVKTGFTAQAGKCVIAAVQRDGRRVLLVLLNAPDRWWTAAAMLDHVFSPSAPLNRSEPRRP